VFALFSGCKNHDDGRPVLKSGVYVAFTRRERSGDRGRGGWQSG
jgi:hypothetical protein